MGGPRAVAALALFLAAGCGGDDGDGPPPRAKGPDVPDGVVGTVLFEKRTISPSGRLSGVADAELVPARGVRVEVIDASGRTLATTHTDPEGRYGVGGSLPENYQVLAFTEAPDGDAGPGVAVQDLDGNEYAVASPAQAAVGAGEKSVVEVIASAGTGLRLAGAFNIIDVLQRAGRVWEDATEVRPSRATVRWESGGFDQEGTFFTPADNTITLLGGRGDLQDITDTDEFDDTVIAHEYLHFLVWNHAHSSSPGGPHAGQDLVPNLSFEEGLADWFGALANGGPLYQDTVGNEDGSAACAVCDDLETSQLRSVEGIGSEQSVYEILWDLADGGQEGPSDVDGDGVSVRPADLLQAVLDQDDARDYLYLHRLLEPLVESGLLEGSQVRTVLSFPVNHDITFPARDRDDPSTGRDLFPVPLAVGDTVPGAVDAVQDDLSPEERNVTRGFDSIRYYELTLDAAREVEFILRIDGSGEPPEDLDLRILTVRNAVLATSAGLKPEERIQTRLDAGVYVIAVYGFFVRNGGESVPSRASYTLEVR